MSGKVIPCTACKQPVNLWLGLGLDEPDAVINQSESCLCLLGCPCSTLGKQAVKLGRVTQQVFGAVSNRFDCANHNIRHLSL